MNSSPMHVLLLSDAASFHTTRFKRGLTEQGCDVTLASFEEGDDVDILLPRRGPVASLHYTLGIKVIRKIIKQIRPNLISAHYASGYGHVAAMANKTAQLPLVVHLWGSDILIVPHKSYLHRKKTAYALEHADLVLADSKFLLDAAAGINQLPQKAVIPYGVEREMLESFEPNRKFHKPLKVIVPRPHKAVYNNEFIIHALQQEISERKIELTFPNFGEDVERFKKKSQELVGETVSFYDKLPRDNWLNFLNTFDIYLSASTSDSSPVSLLEAMGLGLYPVVGDIPGVREWLNHDNGALFSIEDKAMLRAAVQKIIESGVVDMKLLVENHERVGLSAVFEDNMTTHIQLFKKMIEQNKKI